MGSVRWHLVGVAAVVLAMVAMPVKAADDEVSVHAIEAAAVAALESAQEITAPWQPLFANVEEVTEGSNPLARFGVVAARVDGSVADLARSLSATSPIETIQAGSAEYYAGHSVVTFALLQSPLPAEQVAGEAVEFAFYWRWPGLPTQPANPDANGDATLGATNSFSIGTVGGAPVLTFAQTDGTDLIEYDSRLIAAWQFVAQDHFNVMIAIPGVPEAVWGSALNAATAVDPAAYAIQIAPQATGLDQQPTMSLRERGLLQDAEQIEQWLQILADGRSVADLRGTDAEAEPGPDQVDAGAVLPATPPVEVDVTGRVVDAASSDANGSLWRWIAWSFSGAAAITMLLWLLVVRPRRQSAAWSRLGRTVKPNEAKAVAANWLENGSPVIHGHAVGTYDEWMDAIDSFELTVTEEDRLRGYVAATFGKGAHVATEGRSDIVQFEVRTASPGAATQYNRDHEQVQVDHGTLVGIELETGLIRSMSDDAGRRSRRSTPTSVLDPEPVSAWDRLEGDPPGAPSLDLDDGRVDESGRPQ